MNFTLSLSETSLSPRFKEISLLMFCNVFKIFILLAMLLLFKFVYAHRRFIYVHSMFICVYGICSCNVCFNTLCLCAQREFVYVNIKHIYIHTQFLLRT